jgi:diguanylate cyclase (GGDEF)-like protein
VLLINTSITDALDIAERIRERVAEYKFDFEDHKQLGVTLSIGMSKLNDNDPQKDTHAISHVLIEHADQALYQAKDSGRNQTRLFEITQ